ncbi:hypothetical protein GCM10022278_15660 [Allohahella marinimesophila]|uniref:histidine kinase n=1 Tax=Allohahella marinimesophila TaxID=1054972 RepID=A0ABP7P2C2_9GAMM
MQLHEFITKSMEAILVEWEQFTKTLPPGRHMSVIELRDHAEEILEAIAQDMSEHQSDEDQESKSKGSEKNAAFEPSAQKHVSTRLVEGFDFDQIVAEYRALRASVIRLWTDQMQSASMETLYQLTRFNEALDQSLTYVIKAYSEQTEESRQAFVKELRESDERHRSLADLSPDALFVSLEGRYVYANPAAAHLLGAEEPRDIVGLSPFEQLDQDDRPLLQVQMQKVQQDSSASDRVQYCWKRLDDTPVAVEVSAGPVNWGGQAAVQLIARDIGQRKRDEKALQDVAKHKDEFLATLAHELRNPLAPIQSGIDALRLASDGQSTARTLDIMQRQMGHIIRLVDDLLNVSRLNQGKVNLCLKEMDLATAVHNALEANHSILYAENRQVSVSLSTEPLIVMADPVRLTQIIGNLLSNASKFTLADGRIQISTFRTGQQARICVRDNGVGIAPDNINKVFQMFMQIDEARIGGMGIGLALVRNLVNLHGGTVEAHSKGLGEGSEFIVSLPLLQGQAENIPLDSESPSKPTDHKRVFIVDDNKDAAATLAELMTFLGVQVRTTSDGKSALELMDQFQPDLILLDIGMPEMDGCEVARRIRAREYGWTIRIVAVTGWGREADRQRTLEAGFNDHLVKPVSLKDLEKMMAAL